MSRVNTMGDALQAATFEQFFDFDRIAEPFAAPEIFAHRIGHIEVLRGDHLCLWHVIDHDPGPCGGSQVVVKMIYPFATFMPGRSMTSLWLMRRRLIVPRGMERTRDTTH